MINDARTKQSLSTGQNRLRRNKGAPSDIVAIRKENMTQGTDNAMLSGGINSMNSVGNTNHTIRFNKSSNNSS